MSTRRASRASPSLGARLFVGLQYVLPQHALSRLVWHATRSRRVALKNFLIGQFMRGFHPDMSEALRPEPLSYATFNDFFTRVLRADARPIAADDSLMVSPVDGTISAIGAIDGAQIFQAKGRTFSLPALLGDTAELAERFAGGSFATLYLAPYNYHRIHMPAAATLTSARYLPGRLFSVNASTAASVSGLFARNERIACFFAAQRTNFALVLVGALFVGSMTTHWHGDVTPQSARRRSELKILPGVSARLDKGAQLGRFNMGSTVIMLLPRGAAEWLPHLAAGSQIKVGQPLARLCGP